MVNRKELDPEIGPQAAFGARLRRLRDSRGWTQDELADRIGCTGSHVSAVETGRRLPTRRFAASCDRALGTGDQLERRSLAVRQTALLEGFPEYVTHEGRASEVRLFESGVIPGPLQTREYARALADAAALRGDITPEQATERVDYLIQRQAVLARTPSPLILAVLDESCIRRPIGGADVMDAQLARLVEFAALPNSGLQIAPYSMGESKPFVRMVYLLTLPDRSLMSYVESQTHGHLDREPSSVLPLVRNYHQLQIGAASQAESVAMIENLRKGTL
ncbi:helix-turn-helix domain-containing protein [Streptomyces albipurpureus]|uniref:Helix-turn-helix domain-containing protein n=1 Tax=Streptomyces albipurpureus TaxID=2897419 RepID=A0ABT0UQ33_9ACTN|nr:helix-turn-helix transcriptional regulator [Streptomyces sp. CWNU-1]MCM2389351.1 helix-turn-helix domain-containing protein [Streptomyces sp. CWNU-1]